MYTYRPWPRPRPPLTAVKGPNRPSLLHQWKVSLAWSSTNTGEKPISKSYSKTVHQWGKQITFTSLTLFQFTTGFTILSLLQCNEQWEKWTRGFISEGGDWWRSVLLTQWNLSCKLQGLFPPRPNTHMKLFLKDLGSCLQIFSVNYYTVKTETRYRL